MAALMIVLLLAALFFLQSFLYDRLWGKGLEAKISFREEYATEDDTAVLTEVIVNNKLLPLPVVEIDFHMDRGLRFLDEAEHRGVEVWIRHVVVPGLTDDDRLLDELVAFVRGYRVVSRIEWLPYHTMGVFKYASLGLPYPLEGVPSLAAERIREIRERYRNVFGER